MTGLEALPENVARRPTMDICLLQVPSHAGDDRHPASAGPGRLLQAGAADLLAAQGHRVTTQRADRGEPFRDTASASAAVNRQVAATVRAALDAGQLPIALAGSCITCQGVLAGFDHADCGAVWLDAHADFNTPQTSASGFFPGMSLAVVTGHCYGNYWARIGDSTPLAEETVVLFGVRNLSPAAEHERLERSAIQVVPWHDGRPQGDVLAALDRLATRVQAVYLHIDFDAFAPQVAPGIADEPVPGGLSLKDAEAIIRATSERFRINAVTLATYSPARDRGDRTLRLGLRLLELLGGQARNDGGQR
jgi:arginase